MVLHFRAVPSPRTCPSFSISIFPCLSLPTCIDLVYLYPAAGSFPPLLPAVCEPRGVGLLGPSSSLSIPSRCRPKRWSDQVLLEQLESQFRHEAARSGRGAGGGLDSAGYHSRSVVGVVVCGACVEDRASVCVCVEVVCWCVVTGCGGSCMLVTDNVVCMAGCMLGWA